jgi:SulP family sulfate permease
MFVPQLVNSLRTCSRDQLMADLVAGVVVGVVALPLAMAFAIASGVPPERGLYTAIVAGFLISALGGSKVQIGGPTGAFVVLVGAIVAKYGYPGLAIATFMAGIVLVVMGAARLGGAIKFIPYPVTTGFTAGIAVIIFSSQIKDLLGLRMGPVPLEFVEKWEAYWAHAASISWQAVLLSAVCLAVLVYWPRVTKRLPGAVVVLALGTLLAWALGLDVETIGSRFKRIPDQLPDPSLPHIGLAEVRALVGPALTIAMLAAIESLLSAVVADGMIGGRHKSNMELVAQGVANIASPVFGGIPATGAIARTATNVKNGARTPVAGLVHALTLLLILVVAGDLAEHVPLAVLASILVVVAYNMSEWRACRALMRGPKSDVAVLLASFGLTVLVDLTVAVAVGMVLAAFLFMKQMADVADVHAITREFADPADENGRDPDAISKRKVPDGVEVYEVNGPFFFGMVDRVKDILSMLGKPPRVFILRMRHVPAIDATGMNALMDLHAKCQRQGTTLLLSGVHAQPLYALEKAGYIERIGEENLVPNIDAALARARTLLGGGRSRVATPPAAPVGAGHQAGAVDTGRRIR